MDEFVERQMIALIPRLRRFARSMTGSMADGDDLVQQTCERAIRNIEKWQPGTRLDSWMYRIAQNLYRNTLRQAETQTNAVTQMHDVAPPVEIGHAADTLVTFQAVRAAFDRLPADHRSVLTLVTIEGHSYREAADILEVPVGTIMSRLARARAGLQRILDADEATSPMEAAT